MKTLLGILLVLICAIMVVYAAMIHDQFKSEYEDIEKRQNEIENSQRIVIYTEVQSITISTNPQFESTYLTLKEVNGGYIDVLTNEFYPSRDVRELSGSEAILEGNKVRILY